MICANLSSPVQESIRTTTPYGDVADLAYSGMLVISLQATSCKPMQASPEQMLHASALCCSLNEVMDTYEKPSGEYAPSKARSQNLQVRAWYVTVTLRDSS